MAFSKRCVLSEFFVLSELMLLTLFLAMPFSILLTTNSFASSLTDVNDIVRRANLAAFYAGEDGRAETRMTIIDGQGRKQMRQFTILRRNIEVGGAQEFLVIFSRPSDVKRTAFLVKKYPGAEDDRWLYLPGLDLLKRIAAGDKRTSFVGAHFYYEDISGRDVDADYHTLTKTTDQYYVIRNEPKAPDSVEFSEYTVWVDKKSFMPKKIEYKDSQGKLFRRIEALRMETIDGIETVTKMKVSDLRTGGYTVNEMRFIQYNLGLPSAVFSERSLRNPPRKWLQRVSAE